MGWNRSDGRATPSVSRPGKGATSGHSPFAKALVAGTILVIAAMLTICLIRGRNVPEEGSQSSQTHSRARIATVTPTVSSNRTSHVATKPEWREEYMRSTDMRLKFSTLIKAQTNESGVVTERFKLPNGKTWRMVTLPPPVFSNACDRAIIMAVSAEAGVPMPPVPGLDNADLDKAYLEGNISPLVINETDSPKVVAMKTLVKEARAAILDMIKAGDSRSIGEILQEHVNLNNRIANMHTDALLQIEKVRKEYGDEFAKEYLGKVNENFATYDIPPIGDDIFEKDNDEGETNE